MFGLKKGRNQNMIMLLAVAALIFILFQMNSKSGYAIVEREYSAFGAAPTAGPSVAPAPANGCGMDKGTGLASSLLPREVASDEDFGQFAPEDILKGQNFLEPRQQVGFPEDPYVWNNSTIVPDMMQRGLCA